MRSFRALAALFVALGLAACSEAAPPATDLLVSTGGASAPVDTLPASESEASSAASIFVPASATGEPAEGAAPPELEGTWRRSYEGDPLLLTLRGTGYTVQATGGTGAGGIIVEGDQITFSDSNRCEGTGVYTWEVVEERLRFTPVNDDPCGRADFLPRASFGRVDS